MRVPKDPNFQLRKKRTNTNLQQTFVKTLLSQASQNSEQTTQIDKVYSKDSQNHLKQG